MPAQEQERSQDRRLDCSNRLRISRAPVVKSNGILGLALPKIAHTLQCTRVISLDGLQVDVPAKDPIECVVSPSGANFLAGPQ